MTVLTVLLAGGLFVIAAVALVAKALDIEDDYDDDDEHNDGEEW